MPRGCWTCKGTRAPSSLAKLTLPTDRKVRCDLGYPKCSNCLHAKRECSGYGLRLSWPRESDERRAITYSPPSANSAVPDKLDTVGLDFLNVSTSDVYRYFGLSTAGVVRESVLTSFHHRHSIPNACPI